MPDSSSNSTSSSNLSPKAPSPSSEQSPTEKLTVSPLMATLLLVVIGFGASQYITASQTTQRYPLHLEYQMMQQCMIGQFGMLAAGSFVENQSACVCALRKSTQQVAFNRYNINPDGFYQQIEKNLARCW
ncbi:hypothetical protein [Pelagibaculum spongiae]|uniref:Uncharacterized protein n=1 Tax=Pelagibaculum spongiae TaxID=2080658 RepID=A0A2V1GYU7_9GAMM|nr:hypothetical protein [Pelagibaculum spongiae]PVZ68165.1 hypothetical protein DC094_12745 [Pelagibaculum spongiae]